MKPPLALAFVPGGHSEPRCGNVPLTRTPGTTPETAGTGLLPEAARRDMTTWTATVPLAEMGP